MTSLAATLTLLGLLAAIWWLCERWLGRGSSIVVQALHRPPEADSPLGQIDIVLPAATADVPALASKAAQLERFLSGVGFCPRLFNEAPSKKAPVTLHVTPDHCGVAAGDFDGASGGYCGPSQLSCDGDRTAEIGCAAFLGAVNSRNAASPDVTQLLARLTAALQQNSEGSEEPPSLAAFCRAHIALCRGDLVSLDKAYDALKTLPQVQEEPWTATALRQEVLLSLVIAERHGRAAAAWRGLEALRRLGEIGCGEDELVSYEPRLRRVLAGPLTTLNGNR